MYYTTSVEQEWRCIVWNDQEIRKNNTKQSFIKRIPHLQLIVSKAFQYKALNAILFTNTSLYKIGFIEDERCSFCRHEQETLYHLMFHCPLSE